MADVIDVDAVEITSPPPEPDGAGGGWRTDRAGREYIGAQGRKGNIYRTGGETVEEALERDKRPRDQRPKRKTKAPRKPAPPAKADLKELEKLIVEGLSAPAFVCASFGDEWGANHFHVQAPNLARNLVNAADHNPWLRRKLEEMATGGELPIMLITMLGVAGALVGYAAPPIIYWFNLPVPDRARVMFGIPDRRPDATDTPPAAFAEPPQAA